MYFLCSCHYLTAPSFRQLSGAMIRISNCEDRDAPANLDRTISITGNSESVALAQYLINMRWVNWVWILRLHTWHDPPHQYCISSIFNLFMYENQLKTRLNRLLCTNYYFRPDRIYKKSSIEKCIFLNGILWALHNTQSKTFPDLPLPKPFKTKFNFE